MRKPRTATKRSNQRPRSGQSSTFDWKNHPVIIASGSAAASLLICIPVFTQLVLPTQVAKLEIEILKIKDAKAELERQYSAALKDVKGLGEVRSELSAEVEGLRETVKSLEIQLVEARASNLFSPGSPYPVGLGLVRVGMTPSDIRRVYVEEEIEVSKDGRYVTVKLENFHLSGRLSTWLTVQQARSLITFLLI